VILIQPQITFDKISRPHVLRSRQPVDIVMVKNRARRFTTIRARKAIDLLKHFVVDSVEGIVERSRIPTLQPVQKLLVFNELLLRKR
jgi:hypothetical protein